MAKQTNGPMAQVEKLRAAIEAANTKIQDIEKAPAPLDDALALFGSRLQARAENGEGHLARWALSQAQQAPGYASMLGSAGMVAAVQDGVVMGQTDLGTAADVLKYLNREQLKTAGENAIVAWYGARAGITVPTKDKRNLLEKALDARFALELQEEIVIEEAEAVGMPIARRPDVSPEAVIGIERGALVPHDFYSAKLERLGAESEAARAVIASLAENRRDAGYRLTKLQIDEESHIRRFDVKRVPVPVELAAELAAAKRVLQASDDILSHRRDLAGQKLAVSSRIKEYLTSHRLPKPAKPFDGGPESLTRDEVPVKPEPENWQARFEVADPDPDLADED
jgi:hypothetical protein